jgi:hypothetical protein
MSKFARIVAPVAMLAVMSIGTAAHAQDAGSSSPGASAPGATPGSTTTTIPPRPKPIPVTANPGTGRPGTTVRVSADVRGCTQPGSARGEFRDVVGMVQPLENQVVTWNSRFTGRFRVSYADSVGFGKVRVSCDAGLPTATQGYDTFWVAPIPGGIVVSVTPTAGGPGTVVTVRADIRGPCDPGVDFFRDAKGRQSNLSAAPRSRDRQVVGRYTITSKDAVGRGRFYVTCNARTDFYSEGYASFWVRARGTGGTVGPVPGGPPSGHVTANRGNGKVQTPTAIETGLGGTADGEHRGIDPARLLPPAWVLLVVAAVALRAYHAIILRSQ